MLESQATETFDPGNITNPVIAPGQLAATQRLVFLSPFVKRETHTFFKRETHTFFRLRQSLKSHFKKLSNSKMVT